jgi:hypothetical protein
VCGKILTSTPRWWILCFANIPIAATNGAMPRLSFLF